MVSVIRAHKTWYRSRSSAHVRTFTHGHWHAANAKWLIRNQLKRICARNWPTPAKQPTCQLQWRAAANCDPNTPPIGCGMQTATRTSLDCAPPSPPSTHPPPLPPPTILTILYLFIYSPTSPTRTAAQSVFALTQIESQIRSVVALTTIYPLDS